jgi:hypothetical protein
MEPTKVWRKSWWYNTLFPVVSVVVRTTDPAAAEDESRIESIHALELEIEIEGPDPDRNTIEVEKRLRAFDMILRGAKKADITKNLMTGAGGYRLEIGPHDYLFFASPGNEAPSIYRATASFTIAISLIELGHR